MAYSLSVCTAGFRLGLIMWSETRIATHKMAEIPAANASRCDVMVVCVAKVTKLIDSL
jgi:hypothetical protein